MTMDKWQILSMTGAVAGAAFVTGAVIFKIYLVRIKGKFTSKASLAGKVAIVTGANAGIGYYTALDFARRNARVILACRNTEKGKECVNKIIEETGNKNVEVIKCDLSIMKSVREFAETIKSKEQRLDLLVNNAGMAGLPLTMTEEGFEVMFASNHFGHFLLTNLLLDLLKKSASSRIVNVSSLVHAWCKDIDFENMRAEKGKEKYSTGRVYAESKLANVLFTRELARRLEGTGVEAYCLHPGTITTDLLRYTPLHVKVTSWCLQFFMKSCEEGAATTIYCSVSDEVIGQSGKYFMDCREADSKSSALSKDMGVAKKLWEVSEKLTGLA